MFVLPVNRNSIDRCWAQISVSLFPSNLFCILMLRDFYSHVHKTQFSRLAVRLRLFVCPCRIVSSADWIFSVFVSLSQHLIFFGIKDFDLHMFLKFTPDESSQFSFMSIFESFLRRHECERKGCAKFAEIFCIGKL